ADQEQPVDVEPRSDPAGRGPAVGIPGRRMHALLADPDPGPGAEFGVLLGGLGHAHRAEHTPAPAVSPRSSSAAPPPSPTAAAGSRNPARRPRAASCTRHP